jgi:hypothetical protein
MDCKIAGFNAHGSLLLGVKKGPGVPHMSHLFARFEKKKRIIVSEEGITPEICGNAFRVYLNTGWTSCEQQRKIRWKCSEMGKGGDKNSR